MRVRVQITRSSALLVFSPTRPVEGQPWTGCRDSRNSATKARDMTMTRQD